MGGGGARGVGQTSHLVGAGVVGNIHCREFAGLGMRNGRNWAMAGLFCGLALTLR